MEEYILTGEDNEKRLWLVTIPENVPPSTPTLRKNIVSPSMDEITRLAGHMSYMFPKCRYTVYKLEEVE